MINEKILPLLSRLQALLAQEAIPAYLVGGYVRDLLLGRKTADIDIAVGSSALSVAPNVAKVFGGKYVLLDEKNGVSRVVLPAGEVTTEERCYLDFSTRI